MKSIVLVIPSLAGGGSERVLTAMANYWVEHGRDVAVVTLQPSTKDKYKLDSRVRREELELGRARWYQVRHYRRIIGRLREALITCQPSVIVSFLVRANILVAQAARGLPYPIVFSERTSLSLIGEKLRIKLLRRLIYRKAQIIVAQTEETAAQLRRLSGRTEVVVIPNPISKEILLKEKPPEIKDSQRLIVGLGRLQWVKGWDVLIRAFARLPIVDEDWLLAIYGEGPERCALEKLIASLEVSDRIRLCGWTPDPASVLREASVFVLPSRSEGFPNALLEAMALGLPVIASNCPSGPADIIVDGINGLLVQPDNVNALSHALLALMKDRGKRERLGRCAREVRKRYRLDRIIAQWNRELERVQNILPRIRRR
jgi:GalNAc-alpha-(1->4)-GalNAc-alpha-(1->3)-diNAcBac-PP-undecaprenol alpha-1,4-N-acetyl-D-galactosaminyltransferase